MEKEDQPGGVKMDDRGRRDDGLKVLVWGEVGYFRSQGKKPRRAETQQDGSGVLNGKPLAMDLREWKNYSELNFH